MGQLGHLLQGLVVRKTREDTYPKPEPSPEAGVTVPSEHITLSLLLCKLALFSASHLHIWVTDVGV